MVVVQEQMISQVEHVAQSLMKCLSHKLNDTALLGRIQRSEREHITTISDDENVVLKTTKKQSSG